VPVVSLRVPLRSRNAFSPSFKRLGIQSAAARKPKLKSWAPYRGSSHAAQDFCRGSFRRAGCHRLRRENSGRQRAQAYWAEDVYPPESGAAAKCYDELAQGHHWAISSGAMFAEMVLDGICGISADLSGNVTLRPGLRPWVSECSISNISAHGRNYLLEGGRLVNAD
jgi:hypothetical protein